MGKMKRLLEGVAEEIRQEGVNLNFENFEELWNLALPIAQELLDKGTAKLPSGKELRLKDVANKYC
jgi:hypothetical protein